MRYQLHLPAISLTGLLRIALVFCIAAINSAPGAGAQSFSIAAVVNDEPISAWDVEQRVKFYAATGAGKGSKEAQRKTALDELVDELLMRQEARRVGVSVADSDVTDSINQRLQPLKRTYAQFKQYLGSQGVDISTLENQISARLAWASVIRRTYGSLISITETQIDEAAEGIASKSETPAEELFVLQRITLEVPIGSGDAVFARRMEEADRIRDLFVDCKRNEKTLKRVADVKIEDIPKAKADSLEEPTRSLVLQAKSGQITPPNLTASGVEMIAVCERRSDGGSRQVAERQLLTQELTMLSTRHLRDLRQDAVVDYR